MMEVCLDRNVVMQSAAAEKNFLFAAADAVLGAYLSSTGAGVIPDVLVDVGFAEKIEDTAPIQGIMAFLV